MRFHGSKWLYRSSYTEAELKKWLEFIRENCKDLEKVYCFFNAAAVHNAASLQQIAGH